MNPKKSPTLRAHPTTTIAETVPPHMSQNPIAATRVPRDRLRNLMIDMIQAWNAESDGIVA
jgi:hypothetical protein